MMHTLDFFSNYNFGKDRSQDVKITVNSSCRQFRCPIVPFRWVAIKILQPHFNMIFVLLRRCKCYELDSIRLQHVMTIKRISNKMIKLIQL